MARQFRIERPSMEVKWIETNPATDEYPAEGHYECNFCGELVKPGYTADTVAQYIQGPPSFYIDDLPVDRSTWFAEYKLDNPDSDLDDSNA